MNELSDQGVESRAWEQSRPDFAARPKNAFVPFVVNEAGGSIPDRFQEIARRHPERLAVVDGETSLTYRALNEAVNRVAWAILEAEAASDAEAAPTVALLFEQGLPSIVALMGVIVAGKAYVPLDPSYPRARIETMLEDSQANLILADGPLLERARELASARSAAEHAAVLDLATLDPDLPTENPALERSPDDHAYILYTSGTTGRPKGVLGSHRQVLHFSSSDIRQARICVEDRISMVASLCFSASLTKIFPALLSGATLCPYDLKKRGVESLAGWLTETGITLFTCVPMVFRHLCAMLKPGQTIPGLRVIRMGGDRVVKQDVELYRAHFSPPCLLWLGYGATEAKLITSLWLDHDSELPAGPLPVGYPDLANEIWLLDPEGRPVEAGEVGQIAVSSPYLSPGYWRLPEQTAAGFLPAFKFLPASRRSDDSGVGPADRAPKRVYLTGDLGRRAADGCLWHLGRVDFQVKIRGYRIEIAEIEAALSDLPEVKQAVVTAWQREGSVEPQLVAYIVPDAEPVPTVTDLRRALGEVLPEYMIPTIFVPLAEMPLNVNLKIDRNALPEPETSRPDLETVYLAPRGELEDELVQLWETVLDVEPVGVRDNFFELGGHSLSAARLFGLIAQRWGRELPLLTLLQAPTIEQLAGLLRDEARGSQSSLLVPIQPGGTRLPFFCVIPPRSSAVGLAGLASHLGADQPVYGLQNHRLKALDEGLVETAADPPSDDAQAAGLMPSVQELARLYIQAMRTVQPEGPYALGGRCFGGTVAFEMAQQLLAQGQRVELLALFGSAPPTFQRTGKHLAERMMYHGRQGRLLPVLFEYLPIKVAKARRRLRWQAKRWAGRFTGQAEGAGKIKYVPRVYAGRVTVFQTTEALRDAWAELAAAGVEYHVIEGTHHDMFREPLVAELAARLEACLDQALEKVAAAR